MVGISGPSAGGSVEMSSERTAEKMALREEGRRAVVCSGSGRTMRSASFGS